jgi:hypothetical protein
MRVVLGTMMLTAVTATGAGDAAATTATMTVPEVSASR